MKSIILMPIFDYFASRKKIFYKFLFPLIASIISLILSILFNIGNSEKIISIFSEFIGTQISIIAILVSFSVAIITILVSADNNNIERLKETESSNTHYKPVHGKQLSLFQILLSNIAYNVITEIIYLVGLIAISLIQAVFPIYILKYITTVCIFIILHILLVLLESVSQMYLTFWANKK